MFQYIILHRVVLRLSMQLFRGIRYRDAKDGKRWFAPHTNRGSYEFFYNKQGADFSDADDRQDLGDYPVHYRSSEEESDGKFY